MPTDFSRQFKREVHFKKATGSCSWSKHVKLGSALREVTRALEFLASKTPDRYVFASPKALLASINKKKGKFRKGQGAGEVMSLSTVEKCLPLLQSLGILSPRLHHSPDGRQPTIGWVFAPHDACCETYPKRCAFIGSKKKDRWLDTPDGPVWIHELLADVAIASRPEDAPLADGDTGIFMTEEENEQ